MAKPEHAIILLCVLICALPKGNTHHHPDHDSEDDPEKDPGHDLEQDPGHDLEQDPGHDLEQDPGHALEQDPVRNLKQDPGHGLEQDPGRDLEQDPVRNLKQDPGHGLEQDPGHGQEQDPGHGQEQDPAHGQEQDPEHDLEKHQGKKPGQNSEQDLRQDPEHNPEHDLEQDLGKKAMRNPERDQERDPENPPQISPPPSGPHSEETDSNSSQPDSIDEQTAHNLRRWMSVMRFIPMEPVIVLHRRPHRDFFHPLPMRPTNHQHPASRFLSSGGISPWRSSFRPYAIPFHRIPPMLFYNPQHGAQMPSVGEERGKDSAAGSPVDDPSDNELESPAIPVDADDSISIHQE